MFNISTRLVFASILAVSGVAMADSHRHIASGGLGAYCPGSYRPASLPALAGRHLPGRSQSRYTLSRSQSRYTLNGPSETAWFFHRRGARLFDKQNFGKAEVAFEASLRAQGGTLKEDTLLYLARIAIKTGDLGKAKSYAEDYARVTGKEIKR